MSNLFEKHIPEAELISEKADIIAKMQMYIAEASDESMLGFVDDYDSLVLCYMYARLRKIEKTSFIENELLEKEEEPPEITEFSLFCSEDESKYRISYFSEFFRKRGYIVFEYDERIEVFSPFGNVIINFVIRRDKYEGDKT